MLPRMTLQREGTIPITSGEMLVIDPCYLEDFDMRRFAVSERCGSLEYPTLNATKALLSMRFALEKRKDRKQKLQERLDKIEQRMEDVKNTPTLNPPYFGQFNRGGALSYGYR